MASLASFTRSAARATSSAYRQLPIRWRLAGGSALLTLVILMGFAITVGALTTRRIRADFDAEMRDAATDLQSRIRLGFRADGTVGCTAPELDAYAAGEHAVIRVMRLTGEPVCQSPADAPDLGPPGPETRDVHGYRVVARLGPPLALGEPTVIQYARRVSTVRRTVARVKAFLVVGVLGGAGLALLAGLAIARRAMNPIAELTSAAREIERTRDPGGRVPEPAPELEDEVAELARTLNGMLAALDCARAGTESALARQREFVADASHELRTPLTSVLANLELLVDELVGEQREPAASALRSTQRMRRLVADLLLLARADAGRHAARRPTDLGAIVVEAAAELEPVAADHELSVEAAPATVIGARDELHRVAVNLIENALRHTPPGTAVRASVRHDADEVVLAVEDDGPGVPPELGVRIFDRFVRGASDRGGSTGLGLAIVRAVAESHGGSVALDPADGRGARFVVRLPATSVRASEPPGVGAA
jgi:two-component system, OmpR family, sensor kinase